MGHKSLTQSVVKLHYNIPMFVHILMKMKVVVKVLCYCMKCYHSCLVMIYIMCTC